MKKQLQYHNIIIDHTVVVPYANYAPHIRIFTIQHNFNNNNKKNRLLFVNNCIHSAPSNPNNNQPTKKFVPFNFNKIFGFVPKISIESMCLKSL